MSATPSFALIAVIALVSMESAVIFPAMISWMFAVIAVIASAFRSSIVADAK